MSSSRPFSAAWLAMPLLLVVACQPPKSPVKKSLPIVKPIEEKVSHPSKETVLIGIRVEEDLVTVATEGSMRVLDLTNDKSEIWQAGQYKITAKGSGLNFEGRTKGRKIRLHPLEDGCLLDTATKGYRGDFIVVATENGKVTVINELSIDDYLKGVLPREVVVSWAEESLKVQAVASRTYLASHLGSHGKQGFDLCADVHCQVYGGVVKEHPRTNQAVDDTHNEILVYEGKPIGAFFHSNCGGITEQISYVWGNADRAYLPRKRCTYGTKDPRYDWKRSFSFEEILTALKAKTEVKGSQLKSLSVKKKSPSGRAQTVNVVTDAGSYNLTGNSFRLAMHPEKVRSTLWSSVRRHSNAYEFKGKGWGHGVGMCQWGAKGQAEAGRHYREILNFYYPHSELKLWSRSSK